MNALGPRAPRRRRGGDGADRAARARVELLRRTSRCCAWPSGCRSCSTRPRPGSCSATPAPRRTRRPSRSPAGPAGRTSWPPRTPSTAARWVRSRSPGSRPSARRSSRCPPGCRTSRTATSPRWTPPSTPTPRPSCWSRSSARPGVIVPPEGYLRAAREITAARGALLVLDEVQTGHRPHRRLVRPPGRRDRAGRRHAGQGARRRPADRRVHRDRRGRAAARARASTAPRSAATPSAVPPRWPCSTRSRPTACSSTSGRSARRSRTGIEALGHPLVTDVTRRRADDRCRAGRARVGGGVRGRPGRRLPAQQRRPGPRSGSSRRWCSPRRRPREFLGALPAFLDAGSGSRGGDGLVTRTVPAPSPARRRPHARPSSARSWTWPTRSRPRRSPAARWRARARSRCCSTSPPRAPGCRSRPGIAQLGGTPMIVDAGVQPAGPRRDDRRHRAGDVPLRRRDRLAHRRAGADRGDGRRRDACRW